MVLPEADNKKVLVIEDNVDTLTVIELILSAAGYRVKSFSNWKLGYNEIEIYKPDLLLLDVQLGTADGRNLAKTLKNKADTCHIPIILFSSNHSVVDNLIECQADDFIAKPIKVEDLITVVTIQLSKKA